MKINTGLQGLGRFLGDSLKALELETRIKEQTALLVWDEVVGAQVSSAAQPEFVRDGQLFVTAKSAVWANELTFYKADMVSRINKRIGAKVVKDIIFKVGKVTKPRPQDPESPAGETVDLGGIRLTDAETEELGAAVESLPAEMADKVLSFLETAAKIEKWKRSRGWRECSSCGALQNDPEGVCPVCRLGG
mgnify:CR=1 FL=1